MAYVEELEKPKLADECTDMIQELDFVELIYVKEILKHIVELKSVSNDHKGDNDGISKTKPYFT